MYKKHIKNGAQTCQCKIKRGGHLAILITHTARYERHTEETARTASDITHFLHCPKHRLLDFYEWVYQQKQMSKEITTCEMCVLSWLSTPRLKEQQKKKETIVLLCRTTTTPPLLPHSWRQRRCRRSPVYLATNFMFTPTSGPSVAVSVQADRKG